jgi:hypothetical protein
MIQLETRGGFERPNLGGAPSGHASVIGEYGWLWVNRDGSPTLLTKAIYESLPYPAKSAQECIETASYLLAGLTEYWRSYRHHAGVLFYGYLASSRHNAYTSDYFSDVQRLEFHPAFADYLGEAFKPLGVYVNYWHREIKVGTDLELFVMLCNDDLKEHRGELILTLEAPGTLVELARTDFFLAPLGQQTHRLDVQLPKQLGAFTLKATASSADGSKTVSRRWLELRETVNDPRQVAGQEADFGQKFDKKQ